MVVAAADDDTNVAVVDPAVVNKLQTPRTVDGSAVAGQAKQRGKVSAEGRMG